MGRESKRRQEGKYPKKLGEKLPTDASWGSQERVSKEGGASRPCWCVLSTKKGSLPRDEITDGFKTLFSPESGEGIMDCGCLESVLDEFLIKHLTS